MGWYEKKFVWSVSTSAGDMLKSENLSGLTNVTEARTNLDLGNLATKNQAALGTDTIGMYVENIVGESGIMVSNCPSDQYCATVVQENATRLYVRAENIRDVNIANDAAIDASKVNFINKNLQLGSGNISGNSRNFSSVKLQHV